jgi:hypothetical protein
MKLSNGSLAIATSCAVQFLPPLTIEKRFMAVAGCQYFRSIVEK